MAKRSTAAKARYSEKKAVLESELARYQQMIRDLRSSGESRLLRTKKQKMYHKKILDIKNQLESLS
ncbi:MAG: hypothetical protein GF416_08720 [Candidatus Altiarchaeales archaeon]|nr:hypothetical protein [Candidatus Altiarchaeales archaeon]MBD3417199.1 hypothetical protein [Candidatus Altiarchaeales archaeon]